VSKSLLVAVNGVAGLLLLGMTDLDSSMRLLVAAALVVNVLLLIGKRATLKRPAWLGACASLAGYAGTVVLWLVMAVGCGIEYIDLRIDHCHPQNSMCVTLLAFTPLVPVGTRDVA
jgi:hypothetical protein